MKRNSSFNKLILVGVILFITALFSRDKKQRPKRIRIIQADSRSHKLTLIDRWGRSADKVEVDAGRRLQWLVKTHKIKRLTNIFAKPNNPDVFSELPHPITDTLDWEGTIDASAGGQKAYYNIAWIDNEGKPHPYDPLVQVKP